MYQANETSGTQVLTSVYLIPIVVIRECSNEVCAAFKLWKSFSAAGVDDKGLCSDIGIFFGYVFEVGDKGVSPDERCCRREAAETPGCGLLVVKRGLVSLLDDIGGSASLADNIGGYFFSLLDGTSSDNYRIFNNPEE